MNTLEMILKYNGVFMLRQHILSILEWINSQGLSDRVTRESGYRDTYTIGDCDKERYVDFCGQSGAIIEYGTGSKRFPFTDTPNDRKATKWAIEFLAEYRNL